ncbi:MAG: GNAT family N-acetyltransferase [Longimicrobiales bacterium]|nr:GNAT family N-acetyltransferase [Longimicrobiales bacterium]
MIEEVLGHEPVLLAALGAEGEVEGVLPLVHVEAWPLGRSLISMPFLNDGGPLGAREVSGALLEEAVRDAGVREVDLLEVRSRREHPDAGLEVVDRKLAVILALPDDPKVLWKDGLRSKVRSQIRRPTKDGMEARFGPEQLDAFYPVFAENMRDLGTPVLPRSWFETIRERLPEIVHFGAVYAADGTPVAGGCGFAWKDEFEITWASSLREYSRSAPNMLLYWGFMERMIERGVGAFNFGRCTPGSATHRFKSQWGGVDLPLPWLQWAPAGERRGADASERPLLRMASTAWRHLPRAVADRVGPFLARRLP